MLFGPLNVGVIPVESGSMRSLVCRARPWSVVVMGGTSHAQQAAVLGSTPQGL